MALISQMSKRWGHVRPFLSTIPLQDTLQGGFWRHSAHIWECKINERTQFNCPFLGTEEDAITIILFWVLVGGPISNPKLLSWTDYSNFWWTAGGTKTERRYFNAWKVLEISTQYNFYLESELIGCHGCVLEAQHLCITQEALRLIIQGQRKD